MANKQNYWYILVITDSGPKFITKINYNNKTAEWNEKEKPLEINQTKAKDITIGLLLNFTLAFTVCAPSEIMTQPYRYKDGHFEWKENE